MCLQSSICMSSFAWSGKRLWRGTFSSPISMVLCLNSGCKGASYRQKQERVVFTSIFWDWDIHAALLQNPITSSAIETRSHPHQLRSEYYSFSSGKILRIDYHFGNLDSLKLWKFWELAPCSLISPHPQRYLFGHSRHKSWSWWRGLSLRKSLRGGSVV